MGNFFKEHINPMRAVDLAKAPFEDHGDQPWLQGTLRNMAVAIEGPTIAEHNMEKFLGDTMVNGVGYRDPQNAQNANMQMLMQQQAPADLQLQQQQPNLGLIFANSLRS